MLDDDGVPDFLLVMVDPELLVDDLLRLTLLELEGSPSGSFALLSSLLVLGVSSLSFPLSPIDRALSFSSSTFVQSLTLAIPFGNTLGVWVAVLGSSLISLLEDRTFAISDVELPI